MKSLLPPYLLIHWLELALLKLSILKGISKRKKVIVLIDSGSTDNFIHCKLTKALNFFIYLALQFQVMITDGGTTNFLRKFHKATLIMGEYVLSSPMIAITMGGVDVFLGHNGYNH